MMGPTSLTLTLQRPGADAGAARTMVRRFTAAGNSPTGPTDVLIAAHMAMAARIARGFAGRGEDLDDLTQVAMLELVRAAARFDPARGVEFARYAYPCILGGVKKHFRDNGWGVRVTRRTQELHLQTSRAIPWLAQMLGRTPTIADLAAHLHLSESDTRDGVNGGLAYSTRSLSTPISGDDDIELGQRLGGLDPHVESVPDRHLLDQHVACLPAREQMILRLRFAGGLSQQEIAEQLGMSQMQVSRLLARTIGVLRTAILAKR